MVETARRATGMVFCLPLHLDNTHIYLPLRGTFMIPRMPPDNLLIIGNSPNNVGTYASVPLTPESPLHSGYATVTLASTCILAHAAHTTDLIPVIPHLRPSPSHQDVHTILRTHNATNHSSSHLTTFCRSESRHAISPSRSQQILTPESRCVANNVYWWHWLIYRLVL